jgi:hypothetical protein
MPIYLGGQMFETPHDGLPKGKDGVMALALKSDDSAHLASTKMYKGKLTAWCVIDKGILHDTDSVNAYKFIYVTKANLSNFYIIESEVVQNIRYFLCVNADYKETNDYDVFFSDYSPFFVTAGQVDEPSLLNEDNNAMSNISYFRDYYQALEVFQAKICSV